MLLLWLMVYPAMAKKHILVHSLHGLLFFATLIGPSMMDIPEGDPVILLTDPCKPLRESVNFSRTDWHDNGEGIGEENDESFRKLMMECFFWFKVAPLTAQSIKPLERNTDNSKVFQRRIRQTGPIYPGTKWCGPGDLARSYRDLGHLSKEDQCCRKHDMCPEQISKGQCLLGLCNPSPFTRSHCECDERFRACLQSLKSPAADTIGALYFNVGSNVCFAETLDRTRNSDKRISEAHLESQRKSLELWRKARAASSMTRRKTSECSRKQICQYKYYTQHPYVGATERTTAVPEPRKESQQKRRSSRQSNHEDHNARFSTSDNIQNRGKTESNDNQSAETISEILYHVLRSTGVLKSNGHFQ